MRFARLLFALLLAASLQAQSIDPKAVDALMLRTMKEWKIPGAAVAIVVDDRVVHVQGYGTKRVDGGGAVTPDTLFEIASASKAFTSATVAIAATDGKLAFDDRVREHLDGFRLSDVCADANVTLRDILTHRTGLSRHDELWDNTPLTRDEVIRGIGHVALSKPFRTAYQYQNITFIAAGEAVAKATGTSWDDFAKTRLFEPLAMKATVTSDADWEASTNRATGHAYDWKSGGVREQKRISTTTVGPAGAVKSSARDMANWLRFQLGGGVFEGRTLVDAAILAETKTPHTIIAMSALTRERNPESNLMAYGMGWVIQDYRGETLVSHAGALNGFRTHVDLLPKRKAGFVLMINVGRGISLIALRNTLADMLTGHPARDWNAHYLASERKEDEKDEADRLERIAKRVPNTTPTHALDAYAGDYTHPAYGTASIAVAEGKLVLRWKQLNIPLEHHHYDVFTAWSPDDFVDEEVTFGLDGARKVTSMTIWGERFGRVETKR